ncbi:MAG: GntR family transcriptional regulator, transcriptional repressor for pyruvate dehydrogenase complex [Eubacteriaceae bacterium]|jgi:DNA-binding FadR family transcriptional regulator|nr:GntR family transcriptional regulator, transcriptional repressor for pyruvate dehydrogenase complex [Eubacteriaceae bacterium]
MPKTENRKLGLTPIDSGSIVDKIIDRIVKAISSGQFPIGEKLPSEFILMEELNVGRNSLREAMKILSALGVVTIKRGDGTYVCDHIAPTIFNPIIYSIMFQARSDDHMVEFRRLMDETVLRTAMKKATDRDLAALEKHIDKIRQTYESGDKAKAAYLDFQYHVMIADLCDNPYISNIVNGIYEVFSLSIEDTITTDELFDNAERFHKDILNCLKNKDESAIEAVIAESVSFWYQKEGQE